MKWMSKEGTDLKDGVHDACERPVVGVLRHPEDVQAPFIDVLQVLIRVGERWRMDGWMDGRKRGKGRQ